MCILESKKRENRRGSNCRLAYFDFNYSIFLSGSSATISVNEKEIKRNGNF
jgi:hypothetical protein